MPFFSRALAASGCAAVCIAAAGQSHSFDVSAGGGLASYHSNGSANKGLFEASAVYRFSKHFDLGSEYTYSSLGSTKLSLSSFIAVENAHLDHFGPVIRVPFAMNSHTEPFAAAHFGFVQEREHYAGFGVNVGTTQTQTYNGGYVGGGVGVNLLLRHGFGVRPEVRYQYLRESHNHENEIDVLGSVFYRFGQS